MKQRYHAKYCVDGEDIGIVEFDYPNKMDGFVYDFAKKIIRDFHTEGKIVITKLVKIRTV